MWKNRLGYGLLLAILAVMVFFFGKPFLLCVFALLLLWMVLDCAMLYYEARRIRLRFRLHQGIREGGKISGTLIIESTGRVLSAQWMLLDIEVHNKMFGVSECYHLELEVNNRQKEIEFVVPAEWCGETEIQCGAVCIQDILQLSEKKLRPFDAVSTIIYPRKVNVQVEMSTTTIGSPLDEGVMQNRKGNDPSEVFDIKDYVPGDDLRFVHWKLSGKADHLIMRQPSEPTHYHAIMLMDLGMEQAGVNTTRAELNGAAAMGAAIAEEMIQQGANFCVAIPYKDGLDVKEVCSMKDFQEMQLQWLGTPVQMDAGRGVDYFVLQHLEDYFTRLIIITAGRYNKNIANLSQRIGVTVISTVEDAESTVGIMHQSEEVMEIAVDDLSDEIFRLEC